MWEIQDWTGRNVYPDRTFTTFDDGWDFIRTEHPNEEDWQEYFVIEKESD